MSAMPPVSALPAVPAPAAATGAAATSATSATPGNCTAADGNGGFADALQQARQGAARSRENTPKAAQKDAGKERAVAPREPGRAPGSTDAAAPDEAAPAASGKTSAKARGTERDTGQDGDAGLPPWLAQALTRTPATTDLPAAGDAARAAQASLVGTGNPGGEAEAADKTTAGAALDLAATRPSARGGTNANASSLAAAAEAREDSREQLAAGAEAALPAAAEPTAASTTPLPTPMGSPATGGFSLPAAGEAGAVERPIAPPVASPAFAPALGAELTLMVKEGVSEARLHLNPAEMGPITVQIVVEGQTARVEMTADNAATRQALEQAMPALAGALREDGLTLTGGGVFEQARQPRQGGDGQAPARPGQPPGAATPGRDTDGGPADTAAPRAVPLARGRVDLYA
jgi:flagellar hook-length control protein FliK